MSSTLMMERTGLGMPGIGVPGYSSPSVGSQPGFPASGWLTVPRSTLKVEKCSGGIKLHVCCEDKVACSMVQNLCQMLQGGLCSFSCQLNGLCVYYCNLCMGLCKYECTESGVCITCTSGDSHCCEMIQACGDCLSCMLESNCTCCVQINNTPICCGCCESSGKSGSSSKQASSSKKA